MIRHLGFKPKGPDSDPFGSRLGVGEAVSNAVLQWVQLSVLRRLLPCGSLLYNGAAVVAGVLEQDEEPAFSPACAT